MEPDCFFRAGPYPLRSRESRASINTPGCGWAAETKKVAIGSVPDPFGAGTYTASDKALRGKSGLVHEAISIISML